MNISLDKNDIVKLLNLDIKALILFGSQAQGLANNKSDYDIFVIGPKTNEIYDILYDMLSSKIKKLTNIDIVFETDTPMELKYHVIKYGQIIFQMDNKVFPNFKERIMTIYQDFAPHRKMFQNATFARIN